MYSISVASLVCDKLGPKGGQTPVASELDNHMVDVLVVSQHFSLQKHQENLCWKFTQSMN